jgi:hypothetical protein
MGKYMNAVKEIKRINNQAMVDDACDKAITAGTEQAAHTALIKTHDVCNTLWAKNVADRALGIKED